MTYMLMALMNDDLRNKISCIGVGTHGRFGDLGSMQSEDESDSLMCWSVGLITRITREIYLHIHDCLI